MFLDDSACNLASLNLMKFAPNGTFDVEAYRHACAVVITAQEILVDNSGYPTEAIARNSHDYRPLGLGYANLGALLMAFGLPYDSDAGRDYAACVTAIMCGEAYLQSARIAELCQPLAPAAATATRTTRLSSEPQLSGLPLLTPALAAEPLPRRRLPRLLRQPRALPRRHPHAPRLGQQHRQDQRSRLAARRQQGYLGRSSRPRRALRLPQLAGHRPRAHRHHRLHDGLRHHRHRARPGAGEVQEAGRRRHDQDRQQHRARGAASSSATPATRSTPSSATSTPPAPSKARPRIKDEHLAVFDCSFKPSKGTRSIHYMGHLRMMAATQPFISGAISKTVNLPENATVDDIAEAYIEAWKLGLKAVAIYRDGSKRRSRSAPWAPPPRNRKRAMPAGVRVPQSGPQARSAAQSGLQPAEPIDEQAAPPRRVVIVCPTSASRSPTSSTSADTKATSPSASTQTASPARSSSPWPRKAPPSAA